MCYTQNKYQKYEGGLHGYYKLLYIEGLDLFKEEYIDPSSDPPPSLFAQLVRNRAEDPQKTLPIFRNGV